MNIAECQHCDDFHLLKFKDHLDKIPFQTVSRKCDFFQVYFSDQYNVDVMVDDTFFSGRDKTLVSFLSPLQTLSVDVKNVESLSNGYMLTFQSKFLKDHQSDFDIQRSFPFFNANYSPVYVLDKHQTIFSELFQKMYTLFQEFSADNREIIRSYLNVLLFEARKAFFEGGIRLKFSSRAQEIAFSFENLIKEYSQERNPLGFYADKLNISTVYLSECVKMATGKTAKQVVSEYTILEASALLLQSSKTIDEIADLLGFSATSNFINFFKRETGLTPSKHRKHNIQ